MAKTKKIPHPNTKEKRPEGDWIGGISSYRDTRTGEEQPISKSRIDEIIKDFLKWGEEDKDAFRLTQYIRAHGYPPSTWYFWQTKFPEFAEANQIVKEDIATRRELGVGGVYKRKLDPSMLKMMYYYDPLWDEMEQRSTRLKENIAKAGKPDYKVSEVEMDKAPHTEAVRLKKEADGRRDKNKAE